MHKIILLTNDDGIFAQGLTSLRRAMQAVGKVIVIAPERDNSAISHSLTMSRPLRVRQLEEDVFAVDGTPADCVTLAIGKILREKPDLLVSGINPGENIGDDVNYSGTVSAAVEGTMLGIPSFALSQAGVEQNGFDAACAFATRLASWILLHGLPQGTLLNVNVPQGNRAPKGVRLTHQGRQTWEGAIRELDDPWGRKHYWIGGGTPSVDGRQDSDAQALLGGFISVTPIHLDLTNYAALDALSSLWNEFTFSSEDND